MWVTSTPPTTSSVHRRPKRRKYQRQSPTHLFSVPLLTSSSSPPPMVISPQHYHHHPLHLNKKLSREDESNDTTDSDDDGDESIHNSSVDDIDEMLDYLNLGERGLVTDTSPMQPPVLTRVEHNRDIFRDNIFLGIEDDAENGIACLADPDEFIELGAENVID
eukprot:scaffold94507_cov21-Attheya_sp.AAC.1